MLYAIESPILAAKLEIEIQNALYQGRHVRTCWERADRAEALSLHPYLERTAKNAILYCTLTSAQNDTKMSGNRFRLAIDKTGILTRRKKALYTLASYGYSKAVVGVG
jgi:hypothetical protein